MHPKTKRRRDSATLASADCEPLTRPHAPDAHTLARTDSKARRTDVGDTQAIGSLCVCVLHMYTNVHTLYLREPYTKHFRYLLSQETRSILRFCALAVDGVTRTRLDYGSGCGEGGFIASSNNTSTLYVSVVHAFCVNVYTVSAHYHYMPGTSKADTTRFANSPRHSINRAGRPSCQRVNKHTHKQPESFHHRICQEQRLCTCHRDIYNDFNLELRDDLRQRVVHTSMAHVHV